MMVLEPDAAETWEVDMGATTDRLLAAMNAHDLDAFVACFAADYDSQQPPHPSRAFRGNEQVRKNWEGVFAGVPDFTAELLVATVADGDIEIGEWRWHGTYADGSPFEMRGATVMGIRDDQIAWGRLYMEPVEQGGVDIDEMVQETYRPNR
jgi:ketosteroid isomerase-like protein